MIAGGTHHLESLLTDDKQGYCFADWYEFDGDRVRRRRSFFYRPAI